VNGVVIPVVVLVAVLVATANMAVVVEK